MKFRRMVIGTNDQGKSVFFSDEDNPNTKDFQSTPGLGVARIWNLPSNPTTAVPADEPTVAAGPVLPVAGGSSFMIIQYPPDSVASSPQFDPVAAGAEFAEFSPDMASCMEIDAPGMHRTDTVDYAILLSGRIWIELDDGAETELHPGDTIVQYGARHAWRNKSTEPATLAFVLIDATRA